MAIQASANNANAVTLAISHYKDTMNRIAGPQCSNYIKPKELKDDHRVLVAKSLDVFDELIYFTRVFPHPNLTIEVPMIHVEQLRAPAKKRRRRWGKDCKVEDTRLESIEETIELRHPSDLLDLLNLPSAADSFNTADIASAIDKPRWTAQHIAYVLRKTGAIDQTGRTRAGITYARAA